MDRLLFDGAVFKNIHHFTFKSCKNFHHSDCCLSALTTCQKLKSKLKLGQNRTHIETKFSSKGISKRRVKAPLTTFKHVLLSQKPGLATHIGFREHKNGIFTYEQERCVFCIYIVKERCLRME